MGLPFLAENLANPGVINPEAFHKKYESLVAESKGHLALIDFWILEQINDSLDDPKTVPEAREELLRERAATHVDMRRAHRASPAYAEASLSLTSDVLALRTYYEMQLKPTGGQQPATSSVNQQVIDVLAHTNRVITTSQPRPQNR